MPSARPRPSELQHLRPSNAAGALASAVTAGATALGIALAAEDRSRVAADAAALALAYAALVIFFGPRALIVTIGPAVLLSLVAEDVLLLSQHTHIPQHVSHGDRVRPFPAIEQEVFTRSLR